jgi:shikimate kinase
VGDAEKHSRAYSRVLLVGFMGAGKSSVGKSLARSLGWRFVDFDHEVEREAGATVTQIFEDGGEALFRTLEGRVGSRLLKATEVVLASGGGWPASPGRLQGVPEGTATIWLDVSVDEALRRAASQPLTRPLLLEQKSRERASKLLLQRIPFYASATWRVDTEGSTVEDVTARILQILANQHNEASPA